MKKKSKEKKKKNIPAFSTTFLLWDGLTALVRRLSRVLQGRSAPFLGPLGSGCLYISDMAMPLPAFYHPEICSSLSSC